MTFLGSFRFGSHAQQQHTNGFAEQAIDWLTVLQLDFAAERSKPTLRTYHSVHYGLHCEIGIKIGAKRAVCDALANQFAEESKRMRTELRFQLQQPFRRPATRVQ